MLFNVYIGEDSEDESANPETWDHEQSRTETLAKIAAALDGDWIEGEHIVVRLQEAR